MAGEWKGGGCLPPDAVPLLLPPQLLLLPLLLIFLLRLHPQPILLLLPP